jgi:hypothetical protein
VLDNTILWLILEPIPPFQCSRVSLLLSLIGLFFLVGLNISRSSQRYLSNYQNLWITVIITIALAEFLLTRGSVNITGLPLYFSLIVRLPKIIGTICLALILAIMLIIPDKTPTLILNLLPLIILVRKLYVPRGFLQKISFIVVIGCYYFTLLSLNHELLYAFHTSRPKQIPLSIFIGSIYATLLVFIGRIVLNNKLPWRLYKIIMVSVIMIIPIFFSIPAIFTGQILSINSWWSLVPALAISVNISQTPTYQSKSSHIHFFASKRYLYLLMALIVIALSARVFTKNKMPQPSITTKIPEHFILSLLAAEDILFFHHQGIDWARLRWVLRDYLQTGEISRGASTVAMQLARVRNNLYGKTPQEKLIQMVLATWYSIIYSKEDILTKYLSEVSFGHGINGIEVASNTYFKKNPHDINQIEGELLVLTIEDPSRFTPFHALTPNQSDRLILNSYQKKRIKHIRQVIYEFNSDGFLLGTSAK